MSRWTDAPKSWLIALRVPAINLLSVACVEVLSTAIRRLPHFKRGTALTVTLLLTVAAKALIAALTLITLPALNAWWTLAALVVSALGVGAALFVGRDLFRQDRLRQLSWTRSETAVAVVLCLLLLVFELPLITACGSET